MFTEKEIPTIYCMIAVKGKKIAVKGVGKKKLVVKGKNPCNLFWIF